MKLENQFRLASMASANVHNGGASAIVLAQRIYSITGNPDAVDIVSRVYAHPCGQWCFTCRECDERYLSREELNECPCLVSSEDWEGIEDEDED